MASTPLLLAISSLVIVNIEGKHFSAENPGDQGCIDSNTADADHNGEIAGFKF